MAAKHGDLEDNIYYVCRKKLGLSREKASELLETISPDRLERIEKDKTTPNPYEVKVMAEKYKASHLCNHYCTHLCEIGQEYVPEIHVQDNLPQIVLQTLASLNAIRTKQEKFIEITVDGKIEGDELRDFILIKNELEKISITIESLKLWVEQMKSNGSIDQEEYDRIDQELSEK